MTDHRVRALLIEDNPGDARLIQETLRDADGFDCSLQTADRLAAGLELLQPGKFDVVVLDLSLPDSSGYETYLRLHSYAPHIPVVLLTGLDDEELGARAVRDGAQDYLVKGSLDSSMLARALRYAVERKRFADALRQSELLFEKMFSSLMDAVFLVETRSSKILNCNPAVVVTFGFQPSELIGKPSNVVFCPNGQPRDDTMCSFGKNGHKPGSLHESVAYRKDGSSFHAEYSYVQLSDEISQASIWVVIVRDISARKQAEETLRESQERYELAMRGANDGLWDWNIKTDQVFYSPRWKRMLGYAEHEIGSSPDEWFGRIPPDEREIVRVALTAHLNGHSPHFELEHRMLHRDGSQRWVLVRGLAVRDSSNIAYRMAGSQTDITARKNAEAQLVHDAFHDQLTGLPNRALFMDRLGRTIEHTRRRDKYLFAVLFLDLDRFKIINDSLGHRVGDRLLVEIARSLQTCLRAGDTVARLGGDEFVILLEDISDVNDATRIAKRIQKTLSQPFQVDQHMVFTSASIGVVLSTVGYETQEDVLRDADIAMYQAKLMGKAQYVVFDTAMRSRAIARLELENELRHALVRRELELHYQPIVSLKDEKIIGFEALLRWQHPARGYIPPLEFIPIAEETGLIFEIGAWILREACTQMRRWQQSCPGCMPIKINVNISQRQFNQTELVALVRQVLDETGLDPSSLNLEITENMLMDNAEAMIARLEQLRALGVGLHIDDFGTGYSSLSYLQRFPIDTLKIDYSFIKRIGTNGDGAEIVRTILLLARELGIDAIAEGVETKNQMEQLRLLECDYGQGYFIAEPMQSRLVTGLLRSHQEQRIQAAAPDEIDTIQADMLINSDTEKLQLPPCC